MPIVELGVSEWWTIIIHVKKWITNLARAKSERKRQSKEALRAVIKAVRETTIYLRSLREGAQKSINKEKDLSLLWTELSFRLKDLALTKLANRCRLKGRYWSDPAAFDEAFLKDAAIRLLDIELLADISLKEL